MKHKHKIMSPHSGVLDNRYKQSKKEGGAPPLNLLVVVGDASNEELFDFIDFILKSAVKIITDGFSDHGDDGSSAFCS